MLLGEERLGVERSWRRGVNHEDGVDPAVQSTRPDAVLVARLQSPMEIGNLTMEEKPIGARHCGDGEVSGDIEGRIIFDLDPKTAARMASLFSGTELPETDNLFVKRLRTSQPGDRSAVVTLNDQGFHFRVHPPEVHTSESGRKAPRTPEALVLCFRNEQRQRLL